MCNVCFAQSIRENDRLLLVSYTERKSVVRSYLLYSETWAYIYLI